MVDVEALKKHVWDVLGALYEVHKELGPGLNENVYQEGLSLQLEEQGIEYKKELVFHPIYHNREMTTTYRLDFLCKQDIIIELKSVEELSGVHRSQLYNYMRLYKPKVGILVNFLPKYAQIETYLYDAEKREVLTREGKPLIKVIGTFVR